MHVTEVGGTQENWGKKLGRSWLGYGPKRHGRWEMHGYKRSRWQRSISVLVQQRPLFAPQYSLYSCSCYFLSILSIHLNICKPIIGRITGKMMSRDSAVGIPTALRAGRSGDRIPVEARFSASVQTGPGAHPASYTEGTGSFLGVKRPGRGVDHPPQLSAEVKKRVELYLHSPFGPSSPVLGWN